jgi:hypothetical protein
LHCRGKRGFARLHRHIAIALFGKDSLVWLLGDLSLLKVGKTSFSKLGAVHLFARAFENRANRPLA